MRTPDEIFPFLRRSDFHPASPDANQNIPASLVKGSGGRITTALEYWSAGTQRQAATDATRYMDAGHEAYLASKEAVVHGTWPWQEVFDVGVRLTAEGRVTLDLPGGTVNVYPDTLIFWR